MSILHKRRLATMAMFIHKFLPQHGLSRLGGWLSHVRVTWFKNLQINWVLKRYDVNMDEAVKSDIDEYPHFNAFFTRELRPGAREICQSGVASPADGVLSQFGRVTDGRLLQAKGKNFSLQALLADQEDMVNTFSQASFATIYLSPRDYHRVHMPLTGALQSMVYVPGRLFSVNEQSVENVPDLFARNERVISVFATEHGPMVLILVGAMLVASIKTSWAGIVTPQKKRRVQRWDYPDQSVTIKKGDEMGQFLFGSTVIALFADPNVTWSDAMQVGNQLQLGQALATANIINQTPESTMAE